MQAGSASGSPIRRRASSPCGAPASSCARATRRSPCTSPAPTSPELLASQPTAVLLGLKEEVPYFAVDLSEVEEPARAAALLPGEAEFTDLGDVGALLDRDAGAILAFAKGMVHWHRQHRFCGRCGASTRSEQAGHLRVCTDGRCGAHHFPRTDPAVIMLVARGDEALLGRQRRWRPGMYSTLAGFVEPGESLEEAVVREVLEETGVEVVRPVYRSSQPWPFPSSLMLGFRAEAKTAAIRLEGSELEDARWFARAEVKACPQDTTFRLPGPHSVARALIEEWLAEA